MVPEKPEEGVEVEIDQETYDRTAAEIDAQWGAFKASDLGKWFIGEFRKGITGSED